MRWLLVVLLACRRDPAPPAPRTCVDVCVQRCSEPVRSELVDCNRPCADQCACDDLCSCAWRDVLHGGGPVPTSCSPLPFTLGLDAGSDAAIQDPPDR